MSKRIVVICCAGIIIGYLALWICIRWNSWFKNSTESQYTASSVPSRILITFCDSSANNRNISWQCDSILKYSFVELRQIDRKESVVIDAKGQLFKSPGGKVAYYSACLKGLKQGQQYQYRVCTGRQYSEWYPFSVADCKNSTSFMFIGDIQDSIGGITDKILKNAFNRYPNTEFIVFAGDMIEAPLDIYWKELFSSLDSISHSVPSLVVTGNHDYWKGLICKLDHRFDLVNSYYDESYTGNNKVFTVRYNDIQFFCLDSNREFWHHSRQRRWLKKQLASSRAKWKVIVIHHPLYSVKGRMNNLIHRWAFNDIIKKYDVDLVLQGHEHAYARMRTDKKSTPVYIISHCSIKNYRIRFYDRFDKFGSGGRYYQYIHTNMDTMFISAYDYSSNSLYDSLQIIKHGNTSKIIDYGNDIPENISFHSTNKKKDKQFEERIKKYKAFRRRKMNN